MVKLLDFIDGLVTELRSVKPRAIIGQRGTIRALAGIS